MVPGTEGEEPGRELSEQQLQRLARIVHVGLDLLIGAYAKAEGMDANADEKYGNLCTHWGMFLYNYVTNSPETP